MDKENRGAVRTYVISPTRTVLVWDEKRKDPKWKILCGSVKKSDADIIVAAIREVQEETGIELSRGELHSYTEQRMEGDVYHPFSFVAIVSEEKLDTRSKVGYEDDHDIKTEVFNRSEVLAIPDLLEPHRPFIQEIESWMK